MNDDLILAVGLSGALCIGMAVLVRMFPPGWRQPSSNTQLLAFAAVTGVIFFAIVTAGPSVAIAGAGCAALVLVPRTVVRARRARAIEAGIQALGDPSTQREGIATLTMLIGPPPPADRDRDYAPWARVALHVAAAATRVNLPEQALAWGELVDPSRLHPTMAAVRTQLVAACCIALGDRSRARTELGRVARPLADPTWERALSASEVLLDALEGDPADAERKARSGADAETDPVLRVTWQAAQAHALAALGRREEALALLRSARTALPDVRFLERVARQGGAASPLAASLISGGADVYR